MIKKPYVASLVVLCALPLLFRYTAREPLRLALDDPRPIFSAVPLETIMGSQAGERIHRKPLLEDATYRVQAGDSWWSIAQRYKIRDASKLAIANGNLALVPGAEITIPAELVEALP